MWLPSFLLLQFGYVERGRFGCLWGSDGEA